MNVVRTEKVLLPAKKPYGTKQRKELHVPLVKQRLEFDMEKRLRTNYKLANSSWTNNSKYQSTRRDRAFATSSSLLTNKTRNYASRSATRTTTVAGSSAIDSTTGGTVLAITTGRGDARSEVGIAALNIRCPHLILCQISDSQMYTNTLSKIYLLDPIEVLMPDTMCEHAVGKSALYRTIMDKFPELEITAVSRIHFNDTHGLERIKSLCIPEYSSVELFVKQKYYALAAAAALVKYVEYAQHVIYTPKSMKIEFHGSPNAATIDLESARTLELVQSQCGQRNISLLGVMDRCSTPMGRKLMRANILQPPCEKRIILERQAAVSELVSNRSLRILIQPIVRQLYGADRLVGLSTSAAFHENSVQCAEHNLNYVLLLKNLLGLVPELANILLPAESGLLRKIQKNLEGHEFQVMRDRILETIHPDARSVMGYTSSSMQRCFAIKAGINDLLDIARQTYCELIDDMKTMVENLASKYKLTLSLNCNASLGYHIETILPRNSNPETFVLPAEFIEIRKNKRMYTMTTCGLATLSQQCKIACEELHLMSNVLLCDLLQSVREYIGCLFQLSTDIAELDLIAALAEISSLQMYVKPTFGSKLELLDSRHPVIEVFGHECLVPNNIPDLLSLLQYASIPRNLCIISGANMSGKSTYLKQIVLLHIMAQLGCFVPAKKATFRIADLVFCKIAIRDDIECNASTFTLEMKEAQYILRSVTATSLIVLDELCKGTAIEEGTSIAWAVCEKLQTTTAFIFAATHFSYLTKLANLYGNVTNLYFETINVCGSDADDCHQRLRYTHRLRQGVAPIDDYGIGLAELSDLPKSVTEKARNYASERITVNRVTPKYNDWEATSYAIVVELYELLEIADFDRERVITLVQNLIGQWREKHGKGRIPEDGSRTKESDTYVGRKCENENLGRADSNAVCSARSAGTIEKLHTSETVLDANTNWKDMPAVSSQVVYTDSSTKALQAQSPLKATELKNDTLNYKHNEHYTNQQSNSVDSLSVYSPETENSSSKTKIPASMSGHFRYASDKRLQLAPDSTCSNIPSPCFLDESPTMQLSISTMERSMSKLYEYCLSDDDFKPLPSYTSNSSNL